MVAVKLLQMPSGLTPPQVELARERFLREGRAAGGLDHPNIVRVFDVGEDADSGDMYIVMDFLSGGSLEAVLDDAPLALDRVVTLVGQIASGLDAAHARGMVHRDIKPSNILVNESGTAKIVDFGITYIATSTLTQDVMALGTPAYMSPEHLTAKVLDARADLFSLGVVTYEALTGRKPFEGDNIVAIANAISTMTPLPVSVANPALPRALDQVMERVLAKAPNDRFSTGAEFHQALLACTSNPIAVPKKPRRSVWALAAVPLLAAAIVLLISRGGRGSAIVAVPSAPNALAPAENGTTASPAKAPAAQTSQQPQKPKRQTEAPKSAPHIPVKPEPAPSHAAAKPAAIASSAPAKAQAPVRQLPAANVTISLAHRMRQGTLVVSLDGVPIFDEKFTKSKLAIFQTTVWDPLHAPAGEHAIIARVTGQDGKTYVSDSYSVAFPSGKGIALRIGLKGDALTVKSSAPDDPVR
jgi:serine/threonine-protein kinase